jgi:hypothetical protein
MADQPDGHHPRDANREYNTVTVGGDVANVGL